MVKTYGWGYIYSVSSIVLEFEIYYSLGNSEIVGYAGIKKINYPVLTYFFGNQFFLPGVKWN
jgi:hypothetical protein